MIAELNGAEALKPNTVHVWQMDARDFEAHVPEMLGLLSADEQNRAARFHFEPDRITYVSARAMLRRLLGHYLNLEAAAIEFEYSEFGKPRVKDPCGIEFNVSHSNGMILLAFTNDFEIGVDIEFNQRDVEVEDIVERFFSANECLELLQLPPVEWQAAFYRCWTRKEAFIKAKGGGLSIPLHDFEVSIDPNEAELKTIRWAPEEVTEWRFKCLNCGTDYTAAVIVQNPRAQFEFHQLSSSILSN